MPISRESPQYKAEAKEKGTKIAHEIMSAMSPTGGEPARPEVLVQAILMMSQNHRDALRNAIERADRELPKNKS